MGLIERSAPVKAKKAFLKLLRQENDGGGGAPDSGGGDPGDGDGGPVGGQGSVGGQWPAFITLPVFVLGPRPLARGKVAGGAKQAGWQFLAIDSNGEIISGETQASGAAPTEITQSQGPSWTKAYNSYDKAIKVEQLLANDYEPWSLRIPALNIEAFWMRRKSADDSVEQLDSDLIVPFHTYNPKLLARLFFSMREFIAIAKPLAQKLLEAPPPPID